MNLGVQTALFKKLLYTRVLIIVITREGDWTSIDFFTKIFQYFVDCIDQFRF